MKPRFTFHQGMILAGCLMLCLGAVQRIIQNLQDLNNVRLPAAPTDGHALVYNSTLGVWTNGTVSGGISALNQNQFDSTSTNIKTSPLITNGVFHSSGTTNWSFRAKGTNGTDETYVDKDGKLSVLSSATGGSQFAIRNSAANGYAEVALWDNSGVNKLGFGWGNPSAGFSPGGGYLYTSTANLLFSLDAGGSTFALLNNSATAFQLKSTAALQWPTGTGDTSIRRNAANTVEFDSGTTGVANRGTLLAAKYTARAGTSTSTYNAGGLIVVDTTKTGNVGGGADTLQTNNLPANLFAAAGDSLSFEYYGTNATLASMALTLNFGTNTIYNTTTSPSSDGWVVKGNITRLTATTVLANVEYIQGGSPGSVQTLSSVEYTQTLSSATPLWLTGESGVSMTNDDVVKKLCRLRFEPAP